MLTFECFLQFTTELKPPQKGERGEMKVVPMSLNVIQKVSQVRLYFSNDLRPQDRRMSVLRSIEEVIKRFPAGVPLLDPVKDMKIKDKNFESLLKQIQQFEQRLHQNPIHNSPDAQRLYELYERRANVGFQSPKPLHVYVFCDYWCLLFCDGGLIFFAAIQQSTRGKARSKGSEILTANG